MKKKTLGLKAELIRNMTVLTDGDILRRAAGGISSDCSRVVNCWVTAPWTVGVKGDGQ